MSSSWQNWSRHLCSLVIAGRHQPRNNKWNRGRRDGRVIESLQLEALEPRLLLAWNLLSHNAPANVDTMLVRADGAIMAQQSGGQAWYQLTPDTTGSYVNGSWSNLASMANTRLYYASDVLPSGNIVVVGGEYSSAGGDTNRGEMYNIGSNSWSAIAPYPETQAGDAVSEVLPNGRVLVGYLSGPQTHIYDPASNTWSNGGTKLFNDSSSEESWVKLPDGSILSYDIGGNSARAAQRYLPSSNTWVAAGVCPVELGDNGGANIVNEMGGAFLLPDGRAFFLGASGRTALYTPSTNSWVAGPLIPGNNVTADAPGAVLPNGDVLFAAAPHLSHDAMGNPIFPAPTRIYEYNPSTNGYTDVTPAGYNLNVSDYVTRMVVLPSGQVALANGSNQIDVYTAPGGPNTAWRPQLNSISRSGSTVTLTGTQLNGISEGAGYGDDAQMASNFPLVQLHNIPFLGNPYLRTSNWSSTGVATGSTPETVQFALGTGIDVLLSVVANGISSPTALAIEMSPTVNNILLRVDPSNSAYLQILNNGSFFDDVLFSSFSSILVTCDSSADTLTVDYRYGNPIPAGWLNYQDGSGVDTLNLNDQTTTSNQTWTLGANSVQRSGTFPVTYSNGINFVNVNGGSGNNTYNVNGTEVIYATTINTGNGTDTVNVRATGDGGFFAGGPLTVTTTGSGSNRNTVNVGNAGSLAGITSAVTFDNIPSYDHLVLDDSSDATNRAVHVNANSITGFSTGSINWTSPSGISSLDSIVIKGGTGTNTYTVNAPQAYLGTTLDTGSGADTINVQAISAPLTIDTLSGTGLVSSTVTVGNAGSLAGIAAALTIHNNPSRDTVIINDDTDSTNRTVTVSSSGITGLSAYPINFTNFSVSDLTVNGGTGTNSYTITDTPAAFSMRLNTGTGADTVAVRATSALLTVDTLAGGFSTTAAVTVGNAGSVQGILAALTIHNNPTHDTLTVDDSADTGSRTVTVTADGISGLAPAPISFTNFSVSTLTVLGGSAANHYTISGTPASTSMTLNTGGGTDTVNVQANSVPLAVNTTTAPGGSGNNVVTIGNAGSLAGILAALTVSNGPSYDNLIVDDSADTADRTVTINNSGITGLAPAALNFNAVSITSLTVFGGAGDNTYTVTGPPARTSTTLNTGTGVDTVNVLSSGTSFDLTVFQLTVSSSGGDGNDTVNLGNAGSMQNIFGVVTVTNVTSTTNLNLNDTADASARPVTLAAGSVTGLSPNTINFDDTVAVTLNAGDGANSYTVTGTPAAGTTLNTGAGNDVVNVQGMTNPLVVNNQGGANTINVTSPSNTLDTLQATLTITDASGTATLVVDDSGFADNEGYAIIDPTVSVARLPNFLLTYSGIAALNLYTGPGSDTFDIDSTSVSTTVTAGAGGNIFHISPFTQYLASIVGPLTLNGGGSDTLEFFDANNPNNEAYTFDDIPSSLTLATLPGFAANWTGMGAVYLLTNGASSVDDPSGAVQVDPDGGPPSGSASRHGSHGTPNAFEDRAQTQVVVDLAHVVRMADGEAASRPGAGVAAFFRHAARTSPDPWAFLDLVPA